MIHATNQHDFNGLWTLVRCKEGEDIEDGALLDIALLEGGFSEETARYIAACLNAFENLPKSAVLAGKFKVVPA